MKILILSDLNWHAHLRSVSNGELASFKPSDLGKSRYERLARYFEIVKQESPQLVLFAGDITGDGSCGHGFQNTMKLFLLLLEAHQIHSLFISGNHDPDFNYDKLSKFAAGLKFTQNISNQIVQVNGLNILGLSFRCTASKTSLQKMFQHYSKERIDICLAHAELKRRTRLFDTQAQFIVTGHYDRKCCKIEGSHFVSLDNDWDECSYACVEFESGKLKSSSIHIKPDAETTLSYVLPADHNETEYVLVNGQPALKLSDIESKKVSDLSTASGVNLAYLKYLRGHHYIKLIEDLRMIKKGNPSDTDRELDPKLLHHLEITPKYKVSWHLINDYLKG